MDLRCSKWRAAIGMAITAASCVHHPGDWTTLLQQMTQNRQRRVGKRVAEKRRSEERRRGAADDGTAEEVQRIIESTAQADPAMVSTIGEPSAEEAALIHPRSNLPAVANTLSSAATPSQFWQVFQSERREGVSRLAALALAGRAAAAAVLRGRLGPGRAHAARP